ncbi:pentatricopeptide repeat-containing protein At4g02750-like [Cryptomeria japonica]|uniref:pentatricopeptide repeat-containing protein At4g02750-like n=1 Tax=Cryptomeria japonica TaxID=3369 RepID=UPI0027D9DCF6|nr:pentatricopeptide repeat-containing protein At4g02750-like [Cryptomeria japonica]
MCKQGLLGEALNVLYTLDCRGILPDFYLYSALLQESLNAKSLPQGKLVHTHMLQSGFEPDVFLETKLLVVYIKCQKLEEARYLFNKMPERNVVSWNAMIGAHARSGCYEGALKLFYQMEESGIRFDGFTIASDIPACASLAELEYGRKIHEGIVGSGLKFVARNVFDNMPELNVVSWTAMIGGYKLFSEMRLAGVELDSFTLVGVLQTCRNFEGLQRDKEEVHKCIIRSGFQTHIFVGNALVDMYVKCGSIEDARQVFENMPAKSVVSWTSMIAGYVKDGYVEEAVGYFRKMPERNVVSWTVMVTGYAQIGCVDEALKLFQEMPDRNVVSWTAMISGYTKNGNFLEALNLFGEMQLNGVKPNSDTFGDSYSLWRGIAPVNVVSWNAIITGLVQEGYFDEAQKLFQEMPERDMVSWIAMISGYAQNGCFDKALLLFGEMQRLDLKPSSTIFATALSSCSNLATLFVGKEVHGLSIRREFRDIFVGNALIDMYAKCGSIQDAYIVFEKMPTRDVVSWNAIILGNAIHGCANKALEIFQQMQHSSTKPDQITFIGVLSACCHAGLVDDGRYYFSFMNHHYQITLAIEHYCCVVDLLGRAGGLLDEAQDFISKMPLKPNADVWGSLLGACRIHNNTDLGERVAKCLFESDNKHAAQYVLLSNMYAAAGRWGDVEKVRVTMKQEGVEKTPGCS